MKLPPIPREIVLSGGPAKVRRQKGLLESEEACGKFHWPTRIITLDASLKGPSAWLTLIHERVHIALMDAGVQLEEEQLERVCDALAADRVFEMLNSQRET